MGYRKERSFVKRRLFRYVLGAGLLLCTALILAVLAHTQDLRTRTPFTEPPTSRLTADEWVVANQTLLRARKTRFDAQELFSEFRDYTGWSREESYSRAREFVGITNLTLEDMVEIGAEMFFRAEFNQNRVFEEVSRALAPPVPSYP